MSVRNGDETIAGEDAYEVVPADEPSMDDYPDTDKSLQRYDAFGAPIRPVVKVREGVRDTEQR